MRILILGVGDAQVDAINYLKDNGHFVFGCSYRNEGPGVQLVDQFEIIDIRDKNVVNKYVQLNKINYLYSIGSDVAMPTIGYVSKKLGLPFFISENTAELLQDKSRFRKFQMLHNISPVPFLDGQKLEDFKYWKHYPAILKPVDSQGQRGVFEIRNKKDLNKFFLKSLSYSRQRKVIVEKYINGPEISVNSYIFKGKIKYNLISTREVVENFPGGIVKGHKIPVQIGKTVNKNVLNLVAEAIKKLNIQNGPVYFQMKYEQNQPYIIEVTPRLDGCHLWRLIKMTYGVNLLDLTFEHLFDHPVTFNKSLEKPESMALEFYLGKPGEKFSCICVNEKNDILYNKFYYEPGEKIRPVNGIIEKVGYKIYKVR